MNKKIEIAEQLRLQVSNVVNLGEQRANVLLVATTILFTTYIGGLTIFLSSSHADNLVLQILVGISFLLLLLSFIVLLRAIIPNIKHYYSHQVIKSIFLYSSIQRLEKSDFADQFLKLMNDENHFLTEKLYQIHGISTFAHKKLRRLAVATILIFLSIIFAIVVVGWLLLFPSSSI